MADIDVGAAQGVTPPQAPVGTSLSGKERAGVYLTWGVLGLILVFLAFVLIVLSVNESRTTALVVRMIEGPLDAAKLQAIADERAAFRTFWLELTKTILLNVFLPVLTALLGYVFATTQINNRTNG